MQEIERKRVEECLKTMTEDSTMFIINDSNKKQCQPKTERKHEDEDVNPRKTLFIEVNKQLIQ